MSPKEHRARKALEARVLREWRGTYEVADPHRNVREAGGALDAILKKLHLGEGLEEEKIREAWLEIAGSFIAKHTSPASLKRGVLTIKMTQPSMRFELEQSKGMLLRKVQAHFSAQIVKKLQFVIA